MKLTNFSEADWDAYSGCESDEPLIGEFRVSHLLYEKVLEWDATLILDNESIHVYSISDEIEIEVGFVKVFESSSDAHSFASRLEDCSATYLLCHGFKVI